MIVVDTSALIAVILGEPAAPACRAQLEAEETPLLSAVTLAEALIVAAGRGRRAELDQLLADLACEVVMTDQTAARAAAAAYDVWGKGNHPARLNFVDCFAYVLAQDRRVPLLYVGSDFAQTDVASALPLAGR